MSGEEHTAAAAARFVYWPAEDFPRPEFCQISPSGVVGRESRDVPELADSDVLYCSPDGRWLLLLQRDMVTQKPIKRRAWLWNPTTKQSIELPRWGNTGFIKAAVISHSPDDVFCSCLIYFFLRDCRHLAFCRVGDAKWTFFDYKNAVRPQTATCNGMRNHPNRHACYHLYRPVSLQGKVYALISCSDELVEISVDPFDLIPRITVLNRNHVAVMPVYGSYLLYLVPWQGRHLYLIKLGFPNSMEYTFREVPVIEVFSFDFSARSWFTVHSLRGGAVFLGDAYSLASATSQGKWSFIYYTCRHNQSGRCCLHQTFFSYRMEDGKVTSYGLCPTYMPYQSSISRSCWIMPANTKPTDIEHSVDRADSTTEIAKAMGKNGYLKLKPGLSSAALEPCLKKRKVMENEPVDAQGGYTLMRCSKKEKVLLCNLLPELIESIAENLPSFVDYTYFLNINRLIGSDVQRRRRNTFRPCLIYREKMEDSYCIVDSNINRKVLVKIPKRVRGKSIGCCRYGWLLVEDGRSCCLFNPLTQQFIGTVGYKPRNGGFGISNLTFIGGKPTVLSPEKSSVLAMSLQFRSQGSVLEQGNVAEAGKAVCWKLVAEKFQATCNSPVLLGEDWYYLNDQYIYDRDGNLGRFRLTNMEEGKFEWEVEKLEDPCQLFTRNYLTECGGKLVSVFIGEQGESQLGDTWVRAFKICGDVEKKWEEIHSLGGYCLYLGSTSSISCVAETPDMADRIYFPKFYRDGLVYYSLKTMRYHYITYDQDQGEVTRYHPITMFPDCAWIIPDFSE